MQTHIVNINIKFYIFVRRDEGVKEFDERPEKKYFYIFARCDLN